MTPLGSAGLDTKGSLRFRGMRLALPFKAVNPRITWRIEMIVSNSPDRARQLLVRAFNLLERGGPKARRLAQDIHAFLCDYVDEDAAAQYNAKETRP